MSVSKWFKRLAEKLRAWRDDVRAAIEERIEAAKPKPEAPPESSGEWPLACQKIEAAMVTPLFVMADVAQVKAQAKALKAGGFNAVASLVDLQSGRNYIFPGRTATALEPTCRENIERVLDAGLTPIIIIRNDWAVWGAPNSVIPSVGGQPTSAAAFYSDAILANEKRMLSSLADLFPYVHFQLSIEPQVAESAGFALRLATQLRADGFKGRIIVNPVGAALAAHQAIQGALDEAGCEIASSWHAATPPPYKIWNTDGRPDINSGNAQSILKAIRASGKEFILWSQELANSPNGIPAGYLAASAPAPVPTPSEPVQAGDNTFLWKPVSESRQGRCAVITPANLNVSKVHVNGANQTAEYAGRANGNRQHWFQNKTGAAYGANVKVEAFAANGAVLRTWTVPNGAARWGSN